MSDQLSHITSVFIIGVTGYIGGAVLVALKNAYPDFGYGALVRSQRDIPAIQALGVSVILGSTHDRRLIIDSVASHDVTINCVDADDLDLAKAIIEGANRRASGGQPRPIYIHTSGTGVVTDPPSGKFTRFAEKVWNDNDTDDIASISPNAPHRNVDLEVFAAGENGHIATYIIAPSTIYDIAHTNPVKKISQQIPVLVRTALERGQAIYVGEGTNVWNSVHIYDVAELYVLVFRYALQHNENRAPPPNKFANFFFGSVDEFAWGDIARAVGKILHTRGLIKSPEAVSVEPSKDLEYFMGNTSANSRSVSERARKQLGWNPKGRSLLEALEDDVGAVLKLDGRI